MRYNFQSAFDQLREIDKEIITAIYNYRCLSIEQLERILVAKNFKYGLNYIQKRCYFLAQLELLEKKSFGKHYVVYFITKKGISLSKKFLSIFNIAEPSNETLDKSPVMGYLTARQLDMMPSAIPHQFALNNFILTVYEKKILLSLNKTFQLLYHGFMPDSILSNSSIDIFLEMDMCTESTTILKQKWLRYADYLAHSKMKPINYLFFIIDNSTNQRTSVANRIAVVRDSMDVSFLECTRNHFDIFIGEAKDLIHCLYNITYPNSRLNQFFWGTGYQEYDMQPYERILSGLTFDLLVEKDSIRFFCDYYSCCRMSVIHKLHCLNLLRTMFHNSQKFEFNYAILTMEKSQLLAHMKSFNLLHLLDHPSLHIIEI